MTGLHALSILLDAGVKSVVVLAVAGVMMACMKKRSAAARHLLCFLAVASLPVLPVLSWALPGWRVLPGWMDFREARPVVVERPAKADLPVVTPVGIPPAPSRIEIATPATPETVPQENVPSPTVQNVAMTKPAPAHAKINYWHAGFLVWLAGVLLALVPVVLGLFSLHSLGRRARRETAASWLELLRHLLARLGFKRRVALLKTAQRRMPMTWGVLYPKVLLPEESHQWPEVRRSVVLLHELAHAQRWDYLTHLITRLVCALYWFNPLVWLAARRMIAERERACDDIVLRHGAEPADYAEQVLEISAGLSMGWFAGYNGVAMARASNLEGRLRAILDRRRNRSAVTRAVLVSTILLLAAIIVPVAIMKAAPNTPLSNSISGLGGSAGNEMQTNPPAADWPWESAKSANPDIALHWLVRARKWHALPGTPDLRTVPDAVRYVLNEDSVVNFKGEVFGYEWFDVTLPSGRKYYSSVIECLFMAVFEPFGKQAIPALIDLLDSDYSYARLGAYQYLQIITGRKDARYNSDASKEERQLSVQAWKEWWEKNKTSPRLDSLPTRVFDASEWDAATTAKMLQSQETIVAELRKILPEDWTCQLITTPGDMGHPKGLAEPLFRIDFTNAAVSPLTYGGALDIPGDKWPALHPSFRLQFYALADKTRIRQVENKFWDGPIEVAETSDYEVVTSSPWINDGWTGGAYDKTIAVLGRALRDYFGKLGANPTNVIETWLGIAADASGGLTGPSGIAGQVVDDQTGKPIKEFYLGWSTTDPKNPQGGLVIQDQFMKDVFFDGQFALNPEVREFEPGQRVWPRVIAGGYLPQPVTPEAVVWPVRLTNLVVRLKHGDAIHGLVVDDAGLPVVRARTFLVRDERWFLNGQSFYGLSLNNGNASPFKGSIATTDTQGRFTLWSAGTSDEHVVVTVGGGFVWIAPESASPRGGELKITLPKPATVTINYDIPGDVPESQILLRLRPELPEIASQQREIVSNHGHLVLNNLAPGKYELTRTKRLADGSGNGGILGLDSSEGLCEKMTFTLQAGQTQRVDFVRDIGFPIQGEAVGMRAANLIQADVYVRSADGTDYTQIPPRGRRPPAFDAEACDTNGLFTTAVIEPGTYDLVVEAFHTKGFWRAETYRIPDYVGVQRVTVSANNAPPPVKIELHPFASAIEKPSPQPGSSQHEESPLPSTNSEVRSANSNSSLPASATAATSLQATSAAGISKSPETILAELRKILSEDWTCQLIKQPGQVESLINLDKEPLFRIDFTNFDISFAKYGGTGIPPPHPFVRLYFLPVEEGARYERSNYDPGIGDAFLLAKTADYSVVTSFRNINGGKTGNLLERAIAPLGRALEAYFGKFTGEHTGDVLGMEADAAGGLTTEGGFAGQVVDDQTGKPIKEFSLEFGADDPGHPGGSLVVQTNLKAVYFGGQFGAQFQKTNSEWNMVDFFGFGSSFRQKTGWVEGQKVRPRVLADGYLPQAVTTEPVLWPVKLTNLVVRLKRENATNQPVSNPNGAATSPNANSEVRSADSSPSLGITAAAQIPLLERKVSISAEQKPLKDVLTEICHQAKVELELDADGLKLSGVSVDTPVTLKCQNEPLQWAVARIIHQVNRQGISAIVQDTRSGKLVMSSIKALTERQTKAQPAWLNGYGSVAKFDDETNIISVYLGGKADDELLTKLKTLSKLRELDMEATKTITPQGLAQLAELPALEKLNLYEVNTGNDGLGDAALKAVSKIRTLRDLSVAECGVTDAGMTVLESMTQLTSLSLRGNSATDAGAKYLAGLTNLQQLDLSQTMWVQSRMQITDEGLKSLSNLTQLRDLSIGGLGQVTDAGLKHLSGLTELRSFSFAGSAVTTRNLPFSHLESLDLSGSQVTDATLDNITQYRDLRRLSLQFTSVTDAGMERVAQLTELRRLSLRSEIITDAGIAPLRALPKLEHLELVVAHVSDAALRSVSEIRTLTRLELFSNGRGRANGRTFTMDGLQQLKRLPNLRILWITGLELPEGYLGLRELKQLTGLDLVFCNVKDAEEELLQAVMPDASVSAVSGISMLKQAEAVTLPEVSVRITGFAVDAGSGQPVQSCTLEFGADNPDKPGEIIWHEALPGGRMEVAGTDPQDQSHFWGESFRPGKVWARLLASGYQPALLTPNPVTAPLQMTNIVVRLKRGGDLHGSVLDYQNNPLPGLRVYLADQPYFSIQNGTLNSRSQNTATTDSNGRFTLPGGNGTAQKVVVATADGHMFAIAPEVSPGQVVKVTLPQPAALTVHYDIPDDLPVARLFLNFEPQNPDPAVWKNIGFGLSLIVTNRDELALTNLTPGTYRLGRRKVLNVGGGDSGRMRNERNAWLDETTLILTGGSAQRVELVRPSGNALRGEVAGLDQTTAFGAYLYAFSDQTTNSPADMLDRERPLDATATGRDGQFQTARLAPGAYILVAIAFKEPTVFSHNRQPDYIGSAKVIVTTNTAPPVKVELHPWVEPAKAP